jgi:hypothetical protein
MGGMKDSLIRACFLLIVNFILPFEKFRLDFSTL